MKNGKQMVYILIGCAMIILSVGLIFLNQSIGDGGKKTKKSGTSVYTEPVKELILDIEACEFNIVVGNSYIVSYEDAGNSSVSDSLNDEVLRISCKQKSDWFSGFLENGGKNTTKLTLTIPENAVFENADLKFGAAQVNIEQLIAENLVMTLGAGEVDAKAIWAAESAEVKVGAGAIYVEGAILKNAKLDCGVGEMELSGMIIGESTVDCGVGSVDLTVYSEQGDYHGKLDCGLGEIDFGDIQIDGSGKKEYGTSSAKNRMDIKCGIGEVDVRFEE